MPAGAARLAAAALLAAIGLLHGYRGGGAQVSRHVSRLLVWFSLPVLALYTVGVSLPGSRGLQGLAVLGTVYSVASIPLADALAGMLGLHGCRVRRAAVLAAAVQNTIFLPAPLLLSMGSGVEPAVAYSLGYTLVVASMAPLYASRCGSSGGVGARGLLLGLLRYPPFYGLLLGLAWALTSPGWCPRLLCGLHRVAAEATLLSFYVVGRAVALAWPPRPGRGVALVLLWRHLLSPPLHWALALPLGLGGESLAVALLESAMPPATMAIVLASYYRLDEAVAGSAVAYSTPIGVAEGLLLYMLAAG